PAHAHRAGVAWIHAENALDDLRASGPDQSGQRHDLAGADAEGDVAVHTLTGQPVDLQHHVTRLDLLLGEQRAEFAADHAPHDLVDAHLGHQVGGDVSAVAHHRDPLAQRFDLVESV